VFDQASAETREDILASGFTPSDPNQTHRIKLDQQILGDARPQIGAALGEATLELGGCRPIADQRKGGTL